MDVTRILALQTGRHRRKGAAEGTVTLILERHNTGERRCSDGLEKEVLKINQEAIVMKQ